MTPAEELEARTDRIRQFINEGNRAYAQGEFLMLLAIYFLWRRR